MTQLSISVIMPCHNCSQWIGDALASVAAQTYPAKQIIIVNDNSSDDIERAVRNSGVSAEILHTRYGNAALARNEGAQRATEDWLAFLDGDDIWHPNHLASAALTLGTGDVAFFALHRRLLPSGAVEDDPRKPSDFASAGGNLDQHVLCNTLRGPFSGWPTSGMTIQRRRFLEVGGFDGELVRRHDAELLFRVVHAHTWAFSTRPTWLYRTHHTVTISSNSLECAVYFLLALTKIRTLYGPTCRFIDDRIRKQSRVALGAAVRAGRRDLMRRTYQIASRDAPLLWRLSKPVWLLLPTARKMLAKTRP